MKKSIVLLLCSLFIVFILYNENQYYTKLENAIRSHYRDGEIKGIYNNPQEKLVAFEWENRTKNKHVIVLGIYEEKNKKYKYINKDELTLSISNNNNEFIPNYFYKHPKNGRKYIYGLIRNPKNISTISLRYKFNESDEIKNYSAKSNIEDNLFIMEVSSNVGKAFDWEFRLFDKDGNKIKELNSFF